MHESLSCAPPFFPLATSTVVQHDWCFKCKDIHEHSIKPEINWINALYINIVVPCPFLSTKRGHLWDQYIPSCSNLNMPISWLSSPAHIFSACSNCSERCKLSFFFKSSTFICAQKPPKWSMKTPWKPSPPPPWAPWAPWAFVHHWGVWGSSANL